MLRAAEAAQSTTGLIETTVTKVNDGKALVTTTNAAFAEVAESSSKVGDLVSRIASVSAEQAEGIEQVNVAVVDMDRVVQQNAASAEESSAVSDEMTSEAQQMKRTVDEFVSLIGGRLGTVEV